VRRQVTEHPRGYTIIDETLTILGHELLTLAITTPHHDSGETW
jgi:hypothetical protein